MQTEAQQEQTIKQVQAKIAALEAKLTADLQAFQTDTGLTIHSVPISENSAKNLVTARVKVQL